MVPGRTRVSGSSDRTTQVRSSGCRVPGTAVRYRCWAACPMTTDGLRSASLALVYQTDANCSQYR
jgi:hypothetical protein